MLRRSVLGGDKIGGEECADRGVAVLEGSSRRIRETIHRFI